MAAEEIKVIIEDGQYHIRNGYGPSEAPAGSSEWVFAYLNMDSRAYLGWNYLPANYTWSEASKFASTHASTLSRDNDASIMVIVCG